MSIFTKIGHFFVGLFDELKKAYSNLSQEEQIALQNGTGLVDLINSMLTAGVADVRAAIQAKFPNLDEAQLEKGLFQVADTFGLKYTNLDEAIAAIQQHLAANQGTTWAVISHAAASILAIAFTPGEAKIPVIVSLVEYVYQHFIKKSTGN